MAFGSLPFEWIRDGRLKEFAQKKGANGKMIAALKCYLVIAAYREYETGISVLSLNDIAKIGGVSKPMVLQGVALLEAMGLLEIGLRAHKNTNAYRLSGLSAADGNFRKVPQDLICDRLPSLSARHPRNLDALKLYFAMLYLREERTSKAVVSHKRLIEYTGVRPEDVAAANSSLAACHFLHIRLAEGNDYSRTGHPPNEYTLLGDFRGERRFRPRPSDRSRRIPF